LSIKLAVEDGFEPSTSLLAESALQVSELLNQIGAPGRNRTSDLLFIKTAALSVLPDPILETSIPSPASFTFLQGVNGLKYSVLLCLWAN
jgi:hypothetical protein